MLSIICKYYHLRILLKANTQFTPLSKNRQFVINLYLLYLLYLYCNCIIIINNLLITVSNIKLLITRCF